MALSQGSHRGGSAASPKVIVLSPSKKERKGKKEKRKKKEKRRKKKTRREGKRKVVFVKDGVCCARIFEGSWDDLENCRPV